MIVEQTAQHTQKQLIRMRISYSLDSKTCSFSSINWAASTHLNVVFIPTKLGIAPAAHW